MAGSCSVWTKPHTCLALNPPSPSRVQAGPASASAAKADSALRAQRMWQVSDSFPFKWINKKWKEGFYVTSMATSHTRWAVVMSRNAGFIDQCVELDFQYPSEGIHRRWDAGGGVLPAPPQSCRDWACPGEWACRV